MVPLPQKSGGGIRGSKCPSYAQREDRADQPVAGLDEGDRGDVAAAGEDGPVPGAAGVEQIARRGPDGEAENVLMLDEGARPDRPLELPADLVQPIIKLDVR